MEPENTSRALYENLAVAKPYFSAAELGASCNLEPEEVLEFVEHRVITSDCPYGNLYSIAQLTRLNKACRLKTTIGIEVQSAAMALVLLENIEQLEKRKTWMQFACTESTNLTMQ